LVAANLSQALTEADGRRKAAENGVREIKARAKDQVDQVRPLYAEAASRNNAWLGTVSQVIEQASPTAPDVSVSVDPAASALLQWVSARNRALGAKELTPSIADGLKKRIVQELSEIATGTWKDNRGASEQSRKKAAAALTERLEWRTWEDIQ
jgi:hypothetical protein